MKENRIKSIAAPSSQMAPSFSGRFGQSRRSVGFDVTLISTNDPDAPPRFLGNVLQRRVRYKNRPYEVQNWGVSRFIFALYSIDLPGKPSMAPPNLAGLRQELAKGRLLLPEDDEYEASLQRWSTTCVKPAVCLLRDKPYSEYTQSNILLGSCSTAKNH